MSPWLPWLQGHTIRPRHRTCRRCGRIITEGELCGRCAGNLILAGEVRHG